VIAAPIAAWLVRHVPPRILGSAVGGLIILTNTRTIVRSDWVAAATGVRGVVYAVVAVVWVAALAFSIRAHLSEREVERLTRAVAGDEPRDPERVG
jgi:hypothetical protein